MSKLADAVGASPRMLDLGRQQGGISPWYTKTMALAAKAAAIGTADIPVSIDIGAGRGMFTEVLAGISDRVILLEFYPPEAMPANVERIRADLNSVWPVPDATVDFGFSLEVIEHIENPRHFLREFGRVLKPGGFGFLSTPNNHSWTSKLTFLFKGQHRLFQDASYPAHITPILQCDLIRILNECQLRPIRWFYSNHDTVPRLHWSIRLPGRAFSDSTGILFQKPEEAPIHEIATT